LAKGTTTTAADGLAADAAAAATGDSGATAGAAAGWPAAGSTRSRARGIARRNRGALRWLIVLIILA
jgi:hypothetical protein